MMHFWRTREAKKWGLALTQAACGCPIKYKQLTKDAAKVECKNCLRVIATQEMPKARHG